MDRLRQIMTVVFLLVLSSSLAGIRGYGQHHKGHDERVLQTDPRLAPGQIAPVLYGLGDHHHPITTRSEKAQFFFDQGMKLTYGFNHQEALRAFKEAARLDPDCAMAYWGWALVLGPNLNLPMQPDVVPQAYEAAQMALARADQVSEKEADYIRALAKRYSNDPEADRVPLDLAYATAMKELHEKYPDDQDAATLYAAALMNLSPWDYWDENERPRERTPEILSTLEGVIEENSKHLGALHYYIHAVEPVDPERGEEVADLLRGLAPGAGHLTHMPSHIYIQVGRYYDALEANALAAMADEGYITQCRAQGIYPLNYYPHNVHFLAWAAMMLGDSRLTLDASRKIAANVPEDLRENHWAIYQTFLSMPLYSMVRFGQWHKILAEPMPPEKLRFWRGISHYARALAYLHTGQKGEAEHELSKLRKIAQDPATPEVLIGFSSAQTLLTIAEQIVTAELAAKQGDFKNAVACLERATGLQDGLLYTEPPDWYYSVRHSLGAVLLEADQPEKAEKVYRDDLERYPENGHALFGLWQSLKMQNRASEAAEVKKRFEKAWVHADVELSSSRF